MEPRRRRREIEPQRRKEAKDGEGGDSLVAALERADREEVLRQVEIQLRREELDLALVIAAAVIGDDDLSRVVVVDVVLGVVAANLRLQLFPRAVVVLDLRRHPNRRV